MGNCIILEGFGKQCTAFLHVIFLSLTSSTHSQLVRRVAAASDHTQSHTHTHTHTLHTHSHTSHTHTHSHTSHTHGRTPLDDGSARRRDLKYTSVTSERHPCPRRDSNPQSQQASGRTTTLTARQQMVSHWALTVGPAADRAATNGVALNTDCRACSSHTNTTQNKIALFCCPRCVTASSYWWPVDGTREPLRLASKQSVR